MPVLLKDQATEIAIRKLAKLRSTTLTEAVRVACQNELEREKLKSPLIDRLQDVYRQLDTYHRTGLKADKVFFDAESGDNP